MILKIVGGIVLLFGLALIAYGLALMPQQIFAYDSFGESCEQMGGDAVARNTICIGDNNEILDYRKGDK